MIETDHESYIKTQLLATKKLSALLHDLLEKFTTVTSAFEKLKTDHALLAQQLKNRPDVTYDGSPTPSKTTEVKDASSPVLIPQLQRLLTPQTRLSKSRTLRTKTSAQISWTLHCSSSDFSLGKALESLTILCDWYPTMSINYMFCICNKCTRITVDLTIYRFAIKTYIGSNITNNWYVCTSSLPGGSAK